ncbi:hypothetical protein DOY81_015011, partial [Sarcophaga bullata]
FTEFVGLMDQAYSIANLSMTLTVLPNVNSTWYFDIPAIKDKFEYVNLFAFDFLTPANVIPKEADYTHPFTSKDEKNGLPHYNIDFQVQHWIGNDLPRLTKLQFGHCDLCTHWKMTTIQAYRGIASGVRLSLRPAEAGLSIETRGCLAGRGSDLEHKYGTMPIGQQMMTMNMAYGLVLIDPDFAALKLNMPKQKGLGGIACTI